MNDVQENQLSMFYKVSAFLTNNMPELEALIPAIAALATAFWSSVTNLETYEQEATEDITGYAAEKQEIRETMSHKAMMISGGYVAYLKASNNTRIIHKYDFSRSELDAMRDSAILLKVDTLANAVGPIPPATLTPYGISATLKTELENAITAFRAILQETGDQKSQSASAGILVENHIAAAFETLYTIDSLMEATIESAPLLYYQYKFDRGIDDNTSGGGTTPDVVATIVPGAFQVVLTVPYLASRSFKAKNLSADTINWGLSTSAVAFTDIVHTVAAGAESTKTSLTLAPSGTGNLVLFQNTSANPITIELTVFE